MKVFEPDHMDRNATIDRIDTVGVTVGVGPIYSKLAELSASCFTANTGMPSIVLGDKHFNNSNLLHPAALRLKLFDIIDCERVIYFDADWFCLQHWDPSTAKPSSHLFACRDFMLTSEWPHQEYAFDSDGFNLSPIEPTGDAFTDQIRTDYIDEVANFASLKLPWYRWINTGLLVLSRCHHRTLLALALKLYKEQVGHHERYYEQPALMKAIEVLGIQVHQLPRRFNVLAASERRWPNQVIGLHVKVTRNTTFVNSVLHGSICHPDQVIDAFTLR